LAEAAKAYAVAVDAVVDAKKAVERAEERLQRAARAAFTNSPTKRERRATKREAVSQVPSPF
jgi:hypothetical protein